MAAYREARKQLDGNLRPTDRAAGPQAGRISRSREGAIMSLSYRVWCALALTAACWLSIIVLVLALTG